MLVLYIDSTINYHCAILLSLSMILMQVVLSMISPPGRALMRFTENSSSTSKSVSSRIGILMQNTGFASSVGTKVKSTSIFP